MVGIDNVIIPYDMEERKERYTFVFRVFTGIKTKY